jgi:hypothetical protein
MADLSTLSGQTFSAANYADDAGQYNVDFSQFAATGSVTVTGVVPGEFSNADVAAAEGAPPISATIESVDTTTANASRLGTVVVNEYQGGALLDTYTADILAINNGQVLLGIQTADEDPTNTADPYNGNYAILSDSSLSQDPNATTAYSTTLSNTNPTAYSPPCFAAGTMIATPDGEIAVEDIQIGQFVTTLSGEARAVIWTGSRRVDIARHPQPDTVRPVRIAAGAFADNVPSRDLLLSPDHSIHAEGVLIPAKNLVDGSAVTTCDRPTITYVHIELDTHDVVLANNLPAETYLDTGNRTSFANQGATVAHPDFSSAPDNNYFAWEANGCARLVLAGPEVDAVRAHLAARSKVQKAA